MNTHRWRANGDSHMTKHDSEKVVNTLMSNFMTTCTRAAGSDEDRSQNRCSSLPACTSVISREARTGRVRQPFPQQRSEARSGGCLAGSNSFPTSLDAVVGIP